MDEKIGCKDTHQLTEGKILPIFLKLVFPLFFYHLLEFVYSGYEIFVLSSMGLATQTV